MRKKLLIAYYSRDGHTKAMAEAIAKGAEAPEIQISLKRVEDCSEEELLNADGIILGSPAYSGNISWPVKRLIDDKMGVAGRFNGKLGGGFVSAGGSGDGHRCLEMINLALHYQYMKVLEGVVTTERMSRSDVQDECRKYGERIASELM